MAKRKSPVVPINDATMRNFIEEMEERELSANTRSTYRDGISRFAERFSQIDRANIAAFKEQLAEAGMSPQTINLRLCALSLFCQANDVMNMKIHRVKVQRLSNVENVITKEDYHRLLDGLKDDGNIRWYFIVKLLGMTGARVSELIRLTKGDMDRGYAEMHTKGKVRRIIIPAKFAEEAAEYYRDFAPERVLALNQTGTPISTRGVAENLRRFARRYGIDEAVMHPHSFRHMYAIELLNSTGNISLVSDMLGHSSLSITSIYTRLSQKQQNEIVNDSIDW